MIPAVRMAGIGPSRMFMFRCRRGWFREEFDPSASPARSARGYLLDQPTLNAFPAEAGTHARCRSLDAAIEHYPVGPSARTELNVAEGAVAN